jgi:ABC-type phosphate/phosphonate transport system substrate-binding protein
MNGAFARLCCALLVASLLACGERARAEEPLTLVVMDPLAKPLSCPCVQGYAQRDYAQLASRLESELGRPVRVVFNESLKAALSGDAQGRADLVIGKHSVVQYDAQRTQVPLVPIVALSNKEGGTTMKGLVVVPAEDPALVISDLQGHRMIFGPTECDEKHGAALALLERAGLAAPTTLETAAACDEGALLILEDAKQGRRGMAVISSYAQPLLEGCGTIEKGSLRVAGETEPVPFIEAFVNESTLGDQRERVAQSLVKVTQDPAVRIALETRDGFVRLTDDDVAAAKKK